MAARFGWIPREHRDSSRRVVGERASFWVQSWPRTGESPATCGANLLGGVGQQAGSGTALEVRLDGGHQEVEHRTALLSTAHHDGPDPFAPALPDLAAGALRQAAMDGHEADGLLGQVVGGFHVRRRDEAKVTVHVLGEAVGQVAGFARVGHVQDGIGTFPRRDHPAGAGG